MSLLFLLIVTAEKSKTKKFDICYLVFSFLVTSWCNETNINCFFKFYYRCSWKKLIFALIMENKWDFILNNLHFHYILLWIAFSLMLQRIYRISKVWGPIHFIIFLMYFVTLYFHALSLKENIRFAMIARDFKQI